MTAGAGIDAGPGIFTEWNDFRLPTSTDMWTPILDGELKKQALDLSAQIAARIQRAQPEWDPFCLVAQGPAGLSLFFESWGRVEKNARMQALAAVYLDQAIQIGLTQNRSNPSLLDGLTGFAWICDDLQQKQIAVSDSCLSIMDAADELALDTASQSPWQLEYDLLYGRVGLASYALRRLPNPHAQETIDILVDGFEESAERDANGMAWLKHPNWISDAKRQQFPNGYYDFGIAHGIPGILSVLCDINAAQIQQDRVRPLIEAGSRWLLSQMEDQEQVRFRCRKGPGGVEEKLYGPGWCYGDLGVALTLFKVAKQIQSEEIRAHAMTLAKVAAKRSFPKGALREGGLCHGSAGAAHLFNRIYQETGENLFREQAIKWIQLSIEENFPTGVVPLGGSDQLGLLTGYAGLGLAYLAAATSQSPDWDQIFLMSL